MKKKNQLIAAALSVALMGSLAGVTAFAANNNNQQSDTADTAATETAATVTASSGSSETVYVIANTDGSAKKVIVSQKYGSDDADAAQKARSSLTDAQNVKGDNCWQGDTDKALPVTTAITYMLDGKAISADELAGRSGHVTIRFDYTNTQYETRTINGKSAKIYVPFAALTGTLLDSDRFTNVSVTNGKLVDDGDHTVVVGMAFPGLQESLDLDSDTLELPAYVEISADVTDFALDTTLTVVTNSVFSDADEDALDDSALGDLSGDMDKLTDAMTQLMDGSGELYDGLNTLLSSSYELSDGVGKLTSGLQTLDSNSAQLNAGAETVFNTLLDTANTQLQANESLKEAGITIPTLTIANYADTLNGVIASLDPESVIAQAEQVALEKVTAAVRAGVTQAVQQQVTAQVTDAVTAQVQAKVLAGVLEASGVTQKQYDALPENSEVKAGIDAAVADQMQSDAVQQQITAAVAENVAAQMASDEVKALIDQNTEAQITLLIQQNMNSDEVRGQINAAAAQASEGAQQLLALRQQLDSYNTFYTGLRAYTAGVGEAKDGAVKLNGSMPELISGVKKLRDGSGELRDGLKELNDQAIQKLVDALDGDLGQVSDRLQAVLDVSRDYQGFTMNSDGGVKFIFRTEAVEAAE